MKKIWIPILLLIALMLFCLWSSESKFSKPIEYTIKQENKVYTVNGKFANKKQEETIFKLLNTSGVNEINVTSNELNGFFKDYGSMSAVEKIIPSFVKNYKRGEIEYKNKKLTIKGEVRDASIKKSIDNILLDTKVDYSNQTIVVKPSPIDFLLVGKDRQYELSGHFSSSAQLEQLKQTCDSTGMLRSTSVAINDELADAEGALSAVVKIAPIFMRKYADGKLEYKEKILTISGKVESLEDRDLIQSHLSKETKFSVVDNTILDVEKIKAKQRAEAARQKALQEAREKAKQERARKEAEAKAEQERAKKKEEAKAEQERAKKKEEAQAEQERAKKKEEAQAEQARAKQEMKAKAEQERARKDEDAKSEKAKAEAERIKKLMMQVHPEKRKNNAEKVGAKGEPNSTTSENSKAMKLEIDSLLANQKIKFYYGSSRLNRTGRWTVKKVSLIMKKYPSVKIEISGHTDSIGSDAYNMNLSQKRVETVQARLHRYGISKDRMRAVGYGETQPLYPNNTRKHRRKNRRVEIKIIGE